MQNLRKLREKFSLSQQKLAGHICVSQQSVAQYENDVHEPDIETLKLLSKFFNVSVDYIIGNTDVPYQASDATKYLLSEEEQEMMALYRKLSETGRYGLLELLRSITEGP